MKFDLGRALMRIVSWMEIYGVKVTVTELLPEKDAVLIFRNTDTSTDTRPINDMSFRANMSISLNNNIRMIFDRRVEDKSATIKVVSGKEVLAHKQLSVDEYIKIARYFNGDDE
jgi:hypothetical protein